jgi:hypothetical protein
MSGFQGADTTEGGDQFAYILLTGGVGIALTRILTAEAIVPGPRPAMSARSCGSTALSAVDSWFDGNAVDRRGPWPAACLFLPYRELG